jgi:hypothetical protein
MRNACKLLVRRPAGKIYIERPRSRWQDVKINLTHIGNNNGNTQTLFL